MNYMNLAIKKIETKFYTGKLKDKLFTKKQKFYLKIINTN